VGNPKNYYLVREALLAAHREDLIGSGPKCLIRAVPPRVGKPSAPPPKLPPKGKPSAAPSKTPIKHKGLPTKSTAARKTASKQNSKRK
jgi:hypothetical protein